MQKNALHIFELASYFENIIKLAQPKNIITNLLPYLKEFLQLPDLSSDIFEEWVLINNDQLKPVYNEIINLFKFGQTFQKRELIAYFTDESRSVISSKPNPGIVNPLYNKITHTCFLKGVGNILDLYFYAVEFIPEHKRIYQPLFGKILDADIAHDSFVVQALYKIFPLKLDSNQDMQHVKDFIIENKTTIDKIRNSFKHNPILLGGEADGVAFSIAKDLVLKIFTSKFAYESANRAMNQLYKYKNLASTEAMIYDIGIFGKFKPKDQLLYYYIMEKMIPLESKQFESTKIPYPAVRKVVHKIIVEVRMQFAQSKEQWEKVQNILLQDNQSISKLNKIKKLIKNTSHLIAEIVKISYKEEVGEIDKIQFLRKDWLEKLSEEILIKLITGRADLHLGNIGITDQGYLRFFDPVFQFEGYF